jgi:hypothetical protein
MKKNRLFHAEKSGKFKKESKSAKIKTNNKIYTSFIASNNIIPKNKKKSYKNSKYLKNRSRPDEARPMSGKSKKNEKKNANVSNIVTIKNDKNKNAKKIHIQHFKDLVNDSYSFCYLDNTFIVFKSIDDILYVIYTNKNISIISYDLIDNKKIITIKKAHDNYITNFRHYLDINNKRDLIISISCHDNNIKLWDASRWDCLHNFNNIYKAGQLFSACFLNDKKQNQIFIVSGNSNFDNSDCIIILDLKGSKLQEINDSNDNIFFIDNYYDELRNKNFIITGNFGYVKSFDYTNNKLYHKYSENDNRAHYSVIIHDNHGDTQLLESSYDGDVRIWHFHSGDLLKKINVLNEIYNICSWGDDYLFVGCKNGMLKLINLQNGETVQNLMEHTKSVLTIKKIGHPIYGECLITQGNDQRIIVWVNQSL